MENFAPTLVPLRLLLAEDSEITRLMLRHQLEIIGHQLTIVSNGLEAIRELIKQTYDVLLLDVEMPFMDGIETTRAIRESETSRVDPHIPIIALTAYDTPEELEKCLAAGMDLCLGKPVRIDALEKAMRQLLAGRKHSIEHPASDSSILNEALLLDSTIIESDFNLTPEEVEGLCRHLLEELPAINLDLERCIQSGNARDAAEKAHSIAGSTVQFLSPKVQNLVREVERGLRKGEDTRLPYEKYLQYSEKLLSAVQDRLTHKTS